MMKLIESFMQGTKGFFLVGLLSVFLTACGGGDGGGTTDVPDPGPTAGSGDDGSDDDDSGNDDDSGDDGNSGGDDSGDDTGDDSGSNDDDDSDDGNDSGNPNALTFETFQAASFAIGQQDLSAGNANQSGETSDANTLDHPMGNVAYASDQDVMFISDAGNARVLGYQGIPDMSNVNADFVLGQPDFTTSRRNAGSAEAMYSPEAVTTMGGRLMVTDTDLNRVTVYEGIPASGDALPNLVIGQESLEAFSGACDASTLMHPHASLWTPDGKVIVADAGNNRVLVWNEMPAESGAPADFVLGQIDFNNCSYREPENFRHPSAMWSDGERLILADSEKHRVLIWNTFPTENFQEPDVILGQSSMEFSAPNDDDQDGETDGEYEAVEDENGMLTLVENGDATARTLSYPRDVEVHEGKLYVADMDNHRVLIWDEIPTESFTPADNVLGQQDFTSNEQNAGQDATNEQGFQRPVGVSVIGNQLFVTEWENSRVVAFDAQNQD